MPQIKAEKLTFAYPGSYDNIFENLNLQLDSSWKLGLIGRNGRGKTTLLRLLQGGMEYSGTLSCPLPTAYFPYPVAAPQRPTAAVLAGLCPDAEPWQIECELAELALPAEVLARPFATLSQGEQTKALLAALFLQEGRFLLIDEPTNHLDAAARAQVAAYLKRKQGFILVSHDRRFLDGCVDHILSLNRSDVQLQQGNFSSWYTNFSRQQAFEAAQKEKLEKQVKQLQQAAARTESWSRQVEKGKNSFRDNGYVGHKAAKMMQRSKNIEHRREQALEEKAQLLQNTEHVRPLKLIPAAHHAQRIAEFREVSICYDGRRINRPLSFCLERGQRLQLGGRNGSGKSSLIRLLLGEAIAHSGTVSRASQLQISYVPQSAPGLSGSLRDYAEKSGVEEALLKSMLRNLGFERLQLEKDLRHFSAGQQKKLLLAKSLCEQAHLYIWDEPLNYIDIYSRLQLEEVIKEARPTMIFIEHDAAFCENIATQSLCLD
ncbi:MAG: ABC-F type ribosomal protection protein [Firmicutes bacterium]|nr:ABC-F type ribosomal protection protein [Bacillota bacterium]